MKLILLTILISPSFVWANIKTHIVMENSHLCIKSYSRSKCSLDAFTVEQSKPIQKKIDIISKKVPDDIINNTLNHFWANHHTFNAIELLNIFGNVDTENCAIESSNHEKRKIVLQQQIQRLKNQTLVSEKQLVRACMSRKTANSIYPFLKSSSPNKKTQIQ